MSLVCWFVDKQLAAHADGELAGWRSQLLLVHLERCGRCRRAAEEVEQIVAWQRRVLSKHQGGAHVLIGEAFAQVSARLSGERAPREQTGWLANLDFGSQRLGWAKIALVVCVFATAAWMLGRVPAVRAVWVAAGFGTPPAELVAAPDFFRDYLVIEHLDLLERWEPFPASGPRGKNGEPGTRDEAH